MQPGRRANKELTALTGEGTAHGAATVHRIVEAKIHRAPTSTGGQVLYAGESDSQRAMTGPGDGGDISGRDPKPQRWGYVAPSGSRVEVNDASGGEKISIVHHTGAALTIDPDGGVFITSESSRGAGIAAAKGDVYISAGGDIAINGNGTVSVKTSGDLVMDVGGNFYLKCKAYNLVTNAMDETIDGSASRNVTNDQSQVIGGIDRKTVAGDMREQVSGKRISDVAGTFAERVDGDFSSDVGGDHTTKITGDTATHTGGSSTQSVGGNNTINVGSNHVSKAGGNSELHTGGSLKMLTSGDANIDTGGNLTTATGGDMAMSSGGEAAFIGADAAVYGSGGAVNIIGSTVAVAGSIVGIDGETVEITSGTTSVGASTVNLNTGVLNSPDPTGAGGAGGAPNIPDLDGVPTPQGPDGPGDVDGPEEAATMEANDIVDTLTSARKYPEYRGNGVIESAYAAESGTVSHDQAPQAQEVYDEYSGGNQGTSNPATVGGSYDTLPEESPVRSDDIAATDPGVSVPSQHNPGSKISKYFTLGELTNAPLSWPIPPSKWEEVVSQHILVANNVLDAIREKFPDAFITNAYRNNSPNHRTGRAVDIQVANKSLTRHAEIARFARDHLPCDQVFLERSGSGRTHVHLRVAPAGSKVKPKVLTCGDPKCRSRTPGINVEYLTRRGAR